MSFQLEKIISSTGFIGSKFGCAMIGLIKSPFPHPDPNHLDRTQSSGALHLSELAGRITIAGPVILIMKSAFSKVFAEKPSPSCTLFRI